VGPRQVTKRCPSILLEPEEVAAVGPEQVRTNIRAEAGPLPVRPRRAACRGGRATHVLLPVEVRRRRAGGVGGVGAGSAGEGAGWGAGPVGALLDRRLGTVGGWLRRFGSRAEAVRGWFTRLLCAVAPDPVPPQPAGSVWADAVTAMRAAAVAVAA